MALTPESFGEMVVRLREDRALAGTLDRPFDIAVFGFTEAPGQEHVAGYAAVGATWWLESLSPMRGSPEDLLAIVEAGPPA